MQVSATGAALAPLAVLTGAGLGTSVTAGAAQSVTQSANAAFGLNFESLLKIILTQLTYQDPLKPMDNFQFVSQLAQFSQIQQGQDLNDKLAALVSTQSTAQLTSLLGQVVDLATSDPGRVVSGTVKAVSFQNGDPRLTIETSTGQTISNISPASVNQVRKAN